MADKRDSGRRGRFDEDEDEGEDEPDTNRAPADEDPDDENEGEDEQEEQMPLRRKPMQKAVRGRSRALRADRLIKAIEDEVDATLPRYIADGIRAVVPEYIEHIEKSLGDAPRTEVRLSELIKGIGGEFSDANLPIVERQHRLEKKVNERTEEILKAIVGLTELFEDVAASHEKLLKAVEPLGSQSDLLKSLSEQADARSKTTPARQNSAEGAGDAPTPLEKSTVAEIGTESARPALADSDAQQFQRALSRAEAIRTEHFENVPGYPEAVRAHGAGRVTREIAETLCKSVSDVESRLGLSTAL